MKNKLNKIWGDFPITVKVTLWYTVFVVILISIMLTVSFTVANKMTGDLNHRELMEAVIEMTVEMVSNPNEFDEFDDGIYFVKYNSEGIEMGGMSPRGFDLTLKYKENTVRTYEKNGEKYYYFDKKIDNSEGEWIRGIVPVNQLSDEVSKLLIIILILSPLLLLIIVYGGYRIVKKALNPVAKISDTASEIQKNGDFSKRIKIDEGKDEIHRMAGTFNEMLNSLENSYTREKQFSSDVSHELRTPVSVILTESQYSLEYADTVEEAKDSFSVIQRQAKRMSELINQIMELSKIEKQTTIDLQKIFINADKVMIERLLDNLLNNAMKFTKDEISVKLYSENENCIMEIEDNGIGISDEDKKLIWGRFYQLNDSRNKKVNKCFGLGLSLVAKIIEQHNASIDVESKLKKGTKFVAKFMKSEYSNSSLK